MKNIVRRADPTGPLRGKVRPGWELLAINGKPIADVLDYKYYSYDAHLLMQFRTPEGKNRLLRVKKPEGLDPGLEFETYLMDAPRSCANRCIFCFIDQNPPGMRRSIYFKDDDARLRFLMGCYITLTNLSAREIQRIIDLRISPINISVHATDPDLRVAMLGNRRAGELLDVMKRFAAAGVTMNCQIVCCPGWNDGAALDRTMLDLADLHPAVRSVSIVPVGLTKHRQGLPELRPFTPELARETVAQVERFGNACRARLGARVFYCSDELYIRGGLPLPEDAFYEGYPQLENGVGMLRLRETEFCSALKFAQDADGVPFSVACGTDEAPFLQKLMELAKERDPKLDGRVWPIRNDFYGESITVTGLITGGDLIAQLKDKDLGARLLISENMLRREEQDFLDSVTRAQAEAALGLPVIPVSGDGGALCDAFFGVLPEIPVPKADAEDTEYNKYN